MDEGHSHLHEGDEDFIDEDRRERPWLYTGAS
jgi:hypothetical protein